MHAIVVRKLGGVEQLKMEETSTPELKENQVLIKQYAASVNPSDWKKRKGEWGGKIPYIPGMDAAGIVVKTGKNVTKFKPGDRVMANVSGAYAEYVAARESVTGFIPRTIPFTEAVGLPLAGQTAYQALIKVGKLKRGEKVLIHAGSGGVGTLAVQIAKSIGAIITTTTSEENKNFLYSLGAEVVIDYRNEKFEETAETFDLVLDPLGGEVQKKSLNVLKKGGRLVTLAGAEGDKKNNQIEIHDFSMKPTAEGMEFLTKQLSEFELRTFVEQIFPFTEKGVQQATHISEQGHVRGKLVISIRDESVSVAEEGS